ncbi:hypothetical protein ABZ990_26530 [Streptomyces sp. NPDC046203]|uniref:hypothetical protein n=1 Tax=Streptomyces sp. NPDC046203 TaxID=3154602 RepID=UPI0033C13C1F
MARVTHATRDPSPCRRAPARGVDDVPAGLMLVTIVTPWAVGIGIFSDRGRLTALDVR